MDGDPEVLSRLYLHAVLPCLADLIDQDATARETLGDMHASIALRVWRGPAITLHISSGKIVCEPRSSREATVVLQFLGDRHLHAFFAGRKAALPFPVWGAWRIGALIRFARLATRLDAVLNGTVSILATAHGRRLFTRLSLIAAGLGLTPLAIGDTIAQKLLEHTPPGLACFRIAGEPGARVWFEHLHLDSKSGWGAPPRRPDVCVTFGDVEVAYLAMRDELDAFAAVGSGRIVVDGLVPLADALNAVMERLRIYLQPAPR